MVLECKRESEQLSYEGMEKDVFATILELRAPDR